MATKLYIPRRLIAVETIETQKDGFGARLEEIISRILEKVETQKIPASRVVDLPEIEELQLIINHRLHLKVKFHTNSMPAAILPFYSNRNHIFVPEVWRGGFTLRDQQKLLNKMDGKKGTVNLKKATLGGIFSEYEHPLYMNFNLLMQYGLTAAEMAATLLHEFGHAFYACAYADRLDSTNQSLADIARRLMTDPAKADVEYVYRELSRVTDSVTKEEVDKMLNGPKTVGGVTWFNVVAKIVKSQMPESTYDQTAFEQRADNFAARFGYGRHLVLGLDKLYKFTPERNSSARFIVHAIATLSTLAVCAMIGVALFTTSVATFLMMSVFSFTFFYIFREDMQDHTYDKVKDRYLRIRMDLVDQLKDKALPRKVVEDYLSMIYTMDDVLRDTKVVKTLPEYISNFVFSAGRNASNAINDQRTLEALGNNDLFIYAAQHRLQA